MTALRNRTAHSLNRAISHVLTALFEHLGVRQRIDPAPADLLHHGMTTSAQKRDAVPEYEPATAPTPAWETYGSNVAPLVRQRAPSMRSAGPNGGDGVGYPVAHGRLGRDKTICLDPTALNDLEKLGGTPGFAAAALAIFTEESVGLLAEIEQAMADRRYQAVRDAAHSIKGNASCVGAIAMMAASTRIIRADLHLLRQDGEKLVAELRRAFEHVIAEVEILRSQRRERA